MSDDPILTARPWTIKNVPDSIRNRATAAAHKQDQTTAEWLTHAVNLLADRQAGNEVIPPGKPTEPRGGDATPPAVDIDLAGFAQAVNATTAAIVAAGGTPPKSLGRDAAAVIRHYSRTARGLPSLPPRQTGRQNGQTTRLLEGDFSGRRSLTIWHGKDEFACTVLNSDEKQLGSNTIVVQHCVGAINAPPIVGSYLGV